MNRRRVLAAAFGIGLTVGGASAASMTDLAVRSGPKPGALTVLNGSVRVHRLWTAVSVEGRAADGRWKALSTEMNLVRACDADGAVRPLRPVTPLPPPPAHTPPPWQGTSCSGQCNRHCRIDFPWGPGPFRFKVMDADSGLPIYSAPFRMPANAPGPPI